MKVQILRQPDWGDVSLPVGAVVDMPPFMARELTKTGEAVEAPKSTVTQSLVSGAANSFFSATGLWSGLVADDIAAPWAVSSVVSGKKGLLPSFGSEPFYYRDPVAATPGVQVLTQPMVRDHLGIPRQTAAGQVLTWGQRLEENLIRYSNDLTNGTYWLTANGCAVAREYSYDLPARRISGRDGPLYAERAGGYVTRVTGAAQVNSLVRVNTGQVLRAVPHRVSFYAKVPTGSLTFEVRFYVVGGATAVTSTFTVTAADGWQRLALNVATPDGASAYVVGIAPGTYAGTGGGVVLIGGVMLQERLGSETAPSEHIITDGMPVSARWWNGLGLDRIECFGKTNGNSVTAGAFAATAGGRVVEADGVGLPRYSIRSSPTVQQFARTDMENWTATRATIATGVAAPDGTLTAYDIVEDGTGSQSHFAQYTLLNTTTYDNQFMVFSAFCKQRSGGDRAWVYVAFQNLAGANVGAFFNLATGAIGTVSAGLYASIEPWGNGWYRCFVRGPVGTDGAGTNTVIQRIFVAQGDNAFAPVTSTTANGIRVWCPNVTGPLSGAGTPRAMPTRPALNPSANIGLIPGSILARDLTGAIGSTEFAASGTWALYGMIGEPYKSGTAFFYGGMLYGTSGDPAVRCMISVRPGADGAVTDHTLKAAGDCYVGEIFDRFFWQPNKAYKVGDYVVPTDTLPTNSNGKKMFRCQVAGVSGANEPPWNPTYVAVPDTTTNVTSDGTVKWQANINNGLNSDAEEYLGVHLKPTQTGFHQLVKWAWYQTATDYGMFLDGVAGVKQTYPQIESGVVPVLPKQLRVGWYGKQDSTASLPDAAPAGYSPTAAMGVWDTDHQDLVIYHSAPTAEVLQAATELA